MMTMQPPKDIICEKAKIPAGKDRTRERAVDEDPFYDYEDGESLEEEHQQQENQPGSLPSSGSTSGFPSLGRLETEKLKRIRIIFGLFFFAAATFIAVGYWHSIRTNELNALRTHFHDRGTKIVDSLHYVAEKKVNALESLALAASSYANAVMTLRNHSEFTYSTWEDIVNNDQTSNAEENHNVRADWPFVTLPHFETRAASVRALGEAVSITIYPFVTHKNRKRWEEYASTNLQWLQNGLDFEATWGTTNTTDTATTSTNSTTTPNIRRRNMQQQLQDQHSLQGQRSVLNSNGLDDNDNNIHNASISQSIFNFHTDGQIVPSVTETYYFPEWQSSPVAPELINFNLASNPGFQRAITAVQKSRHAVATIDGSTGTYVDSVFRNHWNHIPADFDNSEFVLHPDEPVGRIYVPIFEKLKKGRKDGSTSKNRGNKVVAILVAVFFWETYLTRALPPLSAPMSVVLDSDCDQSHTFQIDKDQKVIYVGNGDRHDKLHASVSHSMYTKIFDDSELQESIESYGGILIDDLCNSSITIYSTKEMEQEHLSNSPWLNAAMVVAIFIFSTVVIAYYDRKVEQRQKQVYTHAKQANAIVTSLFPSAVRKRLFAGIDENQASGSASSGSHPPPPANISCAANKNSPEKKRLGGMMMPSVLESQKNRIKSFLLDDPAKGSESTAYTNVMRESTTSRSNHQHDRDFQQRRMSTAASSVASRTPSNAARRQTIYRNAIVDHFYDVTIMFGEIVGFIAWSSQREPSEVFMLLQTLFQCFDSLAKENDVFKVETVGDVYVAATGLPDPQSDHASRIARFAANCMRRMNQITRNLEVHLGPDTGDLHIRVGLHTGPVTAGVLQGAKARFQVFGDTMNMAARMESNSLPGRIQCSEATAEVLRKEGFADWVAPRKEKVSAKGKGTVQTYWVSVKLGEEDLHDSLSSHGLGLDQGGSINGFEQCTSDNEDMGPFRGRTHHYGSILYGNILDLTSSNNRYQRLIDWNVQLLCQFLKRIAAKRIDSTLKRRKKRNETRESVCIKKGVPSIELRAGTTALDEVTEIITLPQVIDQTDGNGDEARKRSYLSRRTSTVSAKSRTNADAIQLDVRVVSQLRDYVTTIASMYRTNAFHNFEHASHVTMCTNKLLKRVVVRDVDDEETRAKDADKDLHDYTFGIRSDPLCQFALVFCALIHDVDHAGVSNFQLITENATIARLYKNRSVAEQNSVDLAWDLFMDPSYEDLQKAIYNDESEMKRFRQLLVNIVLATDIFDKNMKTIRERRWYKAFQYDQTSDENDAAEEDLEASTNTLRSAPLTGEEGANLKATIVMEHMIQASDVAHTMQHWEVYLKWNERLFKEMYTAYKAGRAARDPSEYWYEGEIMFFDKYIIPLAQKLDECLVFGVSSDECLNYAKQNRKIWAHRGDQIVQLYIQRYKTKTDSIPQPLK